MHIDDDDDNHEIVSLQMGIMIQTSYLSFFLHTDFSPRKFRTKTAQISIKLPKLFKFFSEIWNFSTRQIFLHKYNLWYLWQIWAVG